MSFDKHANYVFAQTYRYMGTKYVEGDRLPDDLIRNPTERQRLHTAGFLKVKDDSSLHIPKSEEQPTVPAPVGSTAGSMAALLKNTGKKEGA